MVIESGARGVDFRVDQQGENPIKINRASKFYKNKNGLSLKFIKSN
jgi:hypothetical protein